MPPWHPAASEPSGLHVLRSFKQCRKLYTQQPTLGKHAASLFDHIAEVFFQFIIYNDNRLSEESTILSPAKIENVTVCT